MAKKAVPTGRCGSCRWSRELPEHVKKGPFVLDCQALPFAYDVQTRQAQVTGPGGQPQFEVDVKYLPRIHTEKDFCAIFEAIPSEVGESGEAVESSEPND